MTVETQQAMAPTRVTADEIIERMNRGEKFAFLDTRNPKAWGDAKTKVVGAMRITSDELGNQLDKIPRDRATITYCT